MGALQLGWDWNLKAVVHRVDCSVNCRWRFRFGVFLWSALSFSSLPCPPFRSFFSVERNEALASANGGKAAVLPNLVKSWGKAGNSRIRSSIKICDSGWPGRCARFRASLWSALREESHGFA